METKMMDLADCDDGLIRDELQRYPDAPSICLERDSAGQISAEARQRSSDVRGMAERHDARLIVRPGYAAIAQYDGRTEAAVFVIDRE